MGFHDKLRQEAKIDSRRFGKSIACDIIQSTNHKKYLIEAEIIPKGVILVSNYKGAFDPVRNLLFAMPRNKYEEFKKIEMDLNTKSDLEKEEQKGIDHDSMKTRVDIRSKLYSFLKQNVILVKMPDCDDSIVPKDPDGWGVLVDSVDVGTAIHGVYSRKTVVGIYEEEDVRE